MSKRYPKIGAINRLMSHKKGMCVLCCENEADSRLDMETSIFRGEDIVYKVHVRCVKGIGRANTLTMLSGG